MLILPEAEFPGALSNNLQTIGNMTGMKKPFRQTLFLASILMLVAGCLQIGTATEPTGSLTLKEAIAIAFENQGSAQSARLQAMAARERITQEQAGNLPSVIGSVYYNVAGRRVSRAAGGFTTSESNSGVQPEVALSYNIFDSGLTSARVRQARSGALAQKATLGAVQNDLALLVASDYYSQLRAGKLVDLRSEQVRLAEEQLKGVEARISVGDAASADSALPLSELRNRQVDLIQARNDLAIAANNLRNTLGLPVGNALELAENSEGLAAPEGDLEELQSEALENRPEVLRARARVESNRAGVSAARVNQMPRLDTVLRLGVTPREDDQRSYWELGAVVSLPLFDAGSSQARVNEAQFGAQASEVELEQTLFDVSADVKEAWTNLSSARERLAASELAVDAARINLQQTTERYNLGASGVTVISLITAQVQFATASSNAIQAEYDLKLAEIQLNRATGRLQ